MGSSTLKKYPRGYLKLEKFFTADALAKYYARPTYSTRVDVTLRRLDFNEWWNSMCDRQHGLERFEFSNYKKLNPGD